jgi:hypothetical protein
MLDMKQWGTKNGGSSGRNPPSRQVSIPQKNVTTEQIDKHEHIAELEPENNRPPNEGTDTPVAEDSNSSGEAGGAGHAKNEMLLTGGGDNTPTREVLATATAEWTHQANTSAAPKRHTGP